MVVSKKICSDFRTLQERWLPTLRSLVSQINQTFSRNFQEMAVAGEVSLGMFTSNLVELTS